MSDINADGNQGTTQIQTGLDGTAQGAAAAALSTGDNTDAKQATPAGAQQPAATDADTQQLELLRDIKSDIATLMTKVDNSQKLAIRNGAIAGAVSGSIAGGVVATGLQFIRHKLGF